MWISWSLLRNSILDQNSAKFRRLKCLMIQSIAGSRRTNSPRKLSGGTLNLWLIWKQAIWSSTTLFSTNHIHGKSENLFGQKPVFGKTSSHRERNQFDQHALDERRENRSGRLSGIRSWPRRENQERSFSGNAGFCRKKRLFSRLRAQDSWYSSIDNLKNVRKKKWSWIAGLKSNRLVSLIQGAYLPVSDLDWTKKLVHRVWLKAYGFVLVSRIVFPNGDIAYIATNDLSLGNLETIKSHSDYRWKIEEFHRGIKQCCGIERCYSTLERSQRNHILCAFLAFLKLELERIQNNVSWYEQKLSISRITTADYLANA